MKNRLVGKHLLIACWNSSPLSVHFIVKGTPALWVAFEVASHFQKSHPFLCCMSNLYRKLLCPLFLHHQNYFNKNNRHVKTNMPENIKLLILCP